MTTAGITTLDMLPYPVVVGEHLEAAVAAFVAARSYSSVILLCDSEVEAHARRFCTALDRARLICVPLGETRKRLCTVESVLDQLAQSGADRGSLCIGMGGGVAGDLFGFAAAIYMRGMAFVNIATSLVAMVDASIGGKTGVDLVAGKNLAGVFRDPVAVFAAVDTLDTLPDRELREGLGEVVKHAVIDGYAAFSQLEALAATPLRMWPWREIITSSIGIKAGIVRVDRLEQTRREILNLGHTFGHGIEFASKYTISHGAAVAIGLRAACLAARHLSRLSQADDERILTLLQQLELPLHAAHIDPAEVLTGMTADKKAQAGKLRFVLPYAIGQVEHGIVLEADLVEEILRALRFAPDTGKAP